MSFSAVHVVPAIVSMVLAAVPVGLQKRRTPDIQRINVLDGGAFHIKGTVKEKNTPLNIALRRRVWLLDQSTHRLIASTWSDAATGAYVFDHIRVDVQYLILAYDWAGLYRAVIADNITAEPRP